MTEMSPPFYLVAVLLLLLACAFVLFPPMMRRSRLSHDRRRVNVNLYRERILEIEQELSQGSIQEEEFQRLKTELERRLLEETSGSPVSAAASGNAKPALKVPLLLALVIPVIAYGIYREVGAKADWDIADTLKQIRIAAAAGGDDSSIVDRLQQQLEERLDSRPTDANYLMLMADLQTQRENYSGAVEHYAEVARLFPQDADIMGRYAQSMYMAEQRQLTPAVLALANQALAIDPQQSTVLGLLGIAHFELGQFPQAVQYWTRLLPLLDPRSPNYRMISQIIEQARSRLPNVGVAATDDNSQGASKVSLTIHVDVDPALPADPEATVFVLARAVQGPPMPLAVARLQVKDLPATVTLDDSMAMMPSHKLSLFNQVKLIARISHSGNAIGRAGDFEGEAESVDVTADGEPITLLIKTIRR